MTRPVCSDATCDRSVVRYRDGAGYCLFHPDAQPPVLDPKTGRPIDPTPLKARRATVDAPARARAPRPQLAAPADGVCITDGCTRPWKHRGVHTQPKAPETAPVDGICTVDGCPRPYKHTGRHTQPWSNTKPTRPGRGGRRPNPLNAAEAARRYLDGEGLFPLAADLHVGVKTLREALTAEGVELRKRGDVQGRLVLTDLATTSTSDEEEVGTGRPVTTLRSIR